VTSHADGSQTFSLVFECPGGVGTCVPVPLDLGSAADQSAVVLYGTGIRNRTSLSGVAVQIGSQSLAAAYAGAAPMWVGLDQVNVVLPRSLAGSGTVNVTVSVAGIVSNVLTMSFK